MNDQPNGFFKRKTTWAALTGILGAGAAYLSGELPAAQAITMSFEALLALALRSAIARQ